MLNDVPAFKKKMLNWLAPFGIFCYLDNSGYDLTPHQHECLVAVGVKYFVEGDDVSKAACFFREKRWLFGHLSYEAMHGFHQLHTIKKDKIGFPLFYFFEPQIVLEITQTTLTIYADEPQTVFDEIIKQSLTEEAPASASIEPKADLSKEEYIQKIQALQAHILRGDCYEINFCQEFSAQGVVINPLRVFQKLITVSPMPFAAFYRLQDKYLLCASPERFLLKRGTKLLSQPMKGTIRRERSSLDEDNALKKALQQSAKDQAENVMIVDLVRNDLTRVCKAGSVKVDELFGVQTFPQVHQMVSTISGEMREDVSFPQIIEALFPMGSMTGAPKQRVMQLIDEYEPSARGIFSGSVGYIKPGGDFDFNVVIRSIMYNALNKYLSYGVGSGITFYSDAEKEWEECLLKAEAIRKTLNHDHGLSGF